MNKDWVFKPSEFYREACERYRDSFPRIYDSEREFEIKSAVDEAELAALLRLSRRLKDVAQGILDPGTQPVYVRKGRKLPNVRVLREQPFSAFFAPKEPDTWFGLYVIKDDEIPENSFENLLIRIQEQMRNAK